MKTVAFVSLLLAMAAPALAAESPIGRVKISRGEVMLVRNGAVFPAHMGAVILKGDTVRTGDKGSAGMTFVDNTLLSVGPNSQIVIDEFVFDPAGGKMAFSSSILRGSLAYVSGGISKLAPETVSIATPTATIGIRGTKFAVRVPR